MRLKIKSNAKDLYYAGLRANRSRNVGFTKAENTFGDIIKKIQSTWVEVDTDFIWDDQYNTVSIVGVSKNGIRILDFNNEQEFSIIDTIEGDVRLHRLKCSKCGHYERNPAKYPTTRQTGKCWWCQS